MLSTITKVILPCLFFILLTKAHGHLMVKQHGTLNIAKNGTFIVLSIPVSAFNNVDDNHDGVLSDSEFNKHQALIIETFHSNVILKENNEIKKLQGILLSPVKPHDNQVDTFSELVIMGQYDIDNQLSPLTLTVELYGINSSETQYVITATRKKDGMRDKVQLTPIHSKAVLFKEASPQ